MNLFFSIKKIAASLVLGIILEIALFSLTNRLFAQSDFTGPKNLPAEQGPNALPSESGQFWMTYDISAYTDLYPTLAEPAKTILEWILYDTGEEFWHKEPFSVLSATDRQLYVYHNEKVQKYISNVLDRFLEPSKKNIVFTVQIILLDSPDWRTKCVDWIHPYPVNNKGISGWIVSSADKQRLLQYLSKRSDYIELNAAQNGVPNTETFGWTLPVPSRSYVRDIQPAASAPQGYVTDSSSVNEGYRIEITPLISTNGDQVEIMFACQSTVLVKMITVPVKVPTASSPRQQMTIEVPQLAQTDLKDKISFPINQVFLIDLGMIPMIQQIENQSSNVVENITKMVSSKSAFRNVLILIQKSDIASNSTPNAGGPLNQGESSIQGTPNAFQLEGSTQEANQL